MYSSETLVNSILADQHKAERSLIIPSSAKAYIAGDSHRGKGLTLWWQRLKDVAMGTAIGLRVDFDGAALRRLARKTKNANPRRRLLRSAMTAAGAMLRGSAGQVCRLCGTGLCGSMPAGRMR